MRKSKVGAVRDRTKLVQGAMLVLVAIGCRPCCERSRDEPPAPKPASRDAVVEFPVELQSEDPEVTAFIRRVIDTCVDGDYESFRLLWSAREDPFPRDAFERGWRAVERVTVLDVQKRRRKAEGDIVYGVHAHVVLDESMPEPERDVVLLMIPEAGQWRLAHAPAALRDQFRRDGRSGVSPDTQPSDPLFAAPESRPADPPDSP